MKQLAKVLSIFFVAVIMSGCAGDRYNRSTGEVIDDTAINAKVVAALVNDPITKAKDIKVEVNRGEVTLTGWASNNSEKKKAEDIAWGVNGVKAVRNNLQIRQ